MTLTNATSLFWLASTRAMEAYHVNRRHWLAVRALQDMSKHPSSERLACAVGGTLVTIGEETGERREI